jgi:hypothetical protein
MIHTLSRSAQFITTTFRPEMLAHADKFYGVTFNKDKISNISAIERVEAMQFVEQVRAHELLSLIMSKLTLFAGGTSTMIASLLSEVSLVFTKSVWQYHLLYSSILYLTIMTSARLKELDGANRNLFSGIELRRRAS